MQKLEKLSNYHRLLLRQIRPYIGKDILDVGAGFGKYAEILESDKRKVTLLDKSDEVIKKSSRSIIKADIEKDNSFGGFDTITCINVLEHIKNDSIALTNMKNALVGGGTIIIMVPLFKFLYGPADRISRHYRRYSRRDIINKVKRSGFKIIRTKHFNLLGVFGWIYQNRVLRNGIHRQSDLNNYDRLLPFFGIIEKIVPFGLSQIIIAKKPQKQRGKQNIYK